LLQIDDQRWPETAVNGLRIKQIYQAVTSNFIKQLNIYLRLTPKNLTTYPYLVTIPKYEWLSILLEIINNLQKLLAFTPSLVLIPKANIGSFPQCTTMWHEIL